MSTPDEVDRSRDNEERKALGWLCDISTAQQTGTANLTNCGLLFKILEPTFSTTLSGNRESNPDAFIESSSSSKPNLVVELKLGIYSEVELHKQFNEHYNISGSNLKTCATSAYDLVYLAKHSVIHQIGISLAPKVASSSGRRVVLWRLIPGERIELADPSKPNHSDPNLNTLLGQGITLTRQPRTPILFLKRSPVNLKAQAILTRLLMKGIATKSGEFGIDDICASIFPVQLKPDEIRRVLGFCEETDLIGWRGTDEFSLQVTYGNTASVSTFFQRVQQLGSPETLATVDSEQMGLETYFPKK